MVDENNNPIMLGDGYLIDTLHKDTLMQRGDFDGEFQFNDVGPNLYWIYIKPSYGIEKPSPRLIAVSGQDTIRVLLKTNNCFLDYPINKCPNENRTTNNVIRVDYGLVSIYSFSDNRNYSKYSGKLKKQGYRTVEEDEQEVLIYIHDEEKNNLLAPTSPCDKYLFCKEHKLIFK